MQKMQKGALTSLTLFDADPSFAVHARQFKL